MSPMTWLELVIAVKGRIFALTKHGDCLEYSDPVWVPIAPGVLQEFPLVASWCL